MKRFVSANKKKKYTALLGNSGTRPNCCKWTSKIEWYGKIQFNRRMHLIKITFYSVLFKLLTGIHFSFTLLPDIGLPATDQLQHRTAVACAFFFHRFEHYSRPNAPSSSLHETNVCFYFIFASEFRRNSFVATEFCSRQQMTFLM